ncbi:MAG: hypothetical protein ACE15F_08260 [bacterium]
MRDKPVTPTPTAPSAMNNDSPPPHRTGKCFPPPGILFGLGLSLLLLLVTRVRIAPPDLAFYYAFARSLVYGPDFSFADEYARFPFAFHELYLTSQGLPANDWPMGTGVLWIPFLLLGRLAALVFPFLAPQPAPGGFSWFDQWIVTFGSTLLYGGGTLWLSALYARRAGLSRPAVLWATGLMAVGSSFSYHLFVNSADSHPPSAFFIVLFLLSWQSLRSHPSPGRLFQAGCALGLAGLVRPHNFLYLLTPLIDRLLSRREPENAPASRPVSLPGWLALAAGAFLAFFPQLLVWKTLYGSWLALPRSEEVLWIRPELYNTLFSDFHGMISWSPLFGIGLLGLFLSRRWLSLLPPVLLQLYIYSCNLAWWSGGSFGNRRMIGCVPLFILGLAALFDAIPKAWLKLVATLAAAWTLSLWLAEVGGTIQLDHYQPWPEILRAVPAGFPPGLQHFFTLPEWGAKTPARLLGGFLVTGLLAAAWAWGPRLRQAPRSWTPWLLALLIGLDGFCSAAALRTPQAVQSADLSAYRTWDRFTWIVYYEKGYYLLRQERYAEALTDMLAAALTEPRFPEPWMYASYICEIEYKWKTQSYHLGRMAVRYGKDTPEFLSFFDKLLTELLVLHPEWRAMVYTQRGVVRGLGGSFGPARDDFNAALAIEAGYPPAVKNLAVLEARRRGERTPFYWE